jgi:hypothetical protein
LSIAVDERNDIETIVDGIAITELLVTAVALIFRCAQDGDFEFGIALLVA